MSKKHPSNSQILREALNLIYGPEGAPKELKKNSFIEQFYRENRGLFAGPIQSVISRYYNISDSEVFVPKRIQDLFMDADALLAEVTSSRVAPEDRSIGGTKEVK